MFTLNVQGAPIKTIPNFP